MSDLTQQALPAHQRVWELIPWIINGRASDADRREVEAHLLCCPDCREELAFQSRIQSALTNDQPPLVEIEPQIALQHLWARIDALGVERSKLARPTRRRFMRRFRRSIGAGLRLAVIVETIALGVVGTSLWMQTHTAVSGYQTLSAPSLLAPGAIVRLVPSPSLRVDELQALLQGLDLQVVGGPSEAGVYSLASKDDLNAALPVATILTQLRASPGVRFAEPVDASQQH